ncbi:MAG: hypothetical protein MUC60_02770 [Oscillatoria sp. Prado101]|nr:hypothetical protein [Oscillatoria sp. Prado101]
MAHGDGTHTTVPEVTLTGTPKPAELLITHPTAVILAACQIARQRSAVDPQQKNGNRLSRTFIY